MRSILFLTQRIPYPPIKGEKIRPLQLIKHLGKSYDIHLGCLVDDPTDWEHVDSIRALCQDTYFAPLNRRRAKIWCLRGLFTGEPLSVVYFRHRGLARWVSSMIDKVHPEAIFVCSSNMAPYILELPRKERVRLVDFADVDSEKWREYAHKATGLMRWVYRREWQLMANLERRIARECDFSTFVSDSEAALFRELVPDCATKVRAVSNGVDQQYFDPAGNFPMLYVAGQPTYVFTGTMDYPPNVDAVIWFATRILPIIRYTLPSAQFYIVGSNPSPAVLRLADAEGIHVTGRVPDVRPYIAHATAGVAPMRFARGIQNKVLEAMAMGKPIIVTREALEGIEAEPGRDLILANDAVSFAAAACHLATNSDRSKIGAAARRQIVARYGWAERLCGFDTLLGAA